MGLLFLAEGGITGWFIALITAVITSLVVGFFSHIENRKLNKYFKEKDAQELQREAEKKELEQLKKQEMIENQEELFKKILNESLKPISDKVDKIEDGTLSCLRDNILKFYYSCSAKGYRQDWDFENIHHLYDSYKALHGNSFIEETMEKFHNLPTKEEYLAQQEKNRNKK